MGSVTIYYEDTPPSLNTARGWHWAKQRGEKASWQRIFEALLMQHPQLRWRGYRVHATAHLDFPTMRRRDEGNFRWMLEKALGDALQHTGIIADDTPEWFTFGRLTFGMGKRRTTITMEVE